MKTNKVLFYSTLVLSIITFVLSIGFNCCTNTQIKFWSNVMLAIFGSSVLVMLSSIAGYFTEKRKYIYKYSAFARSFTLQIGRFVNRYQNKNEKPEQIYSDAGLLHSYYDNFAYENSIDILGYFCHKGQAKLNMRKLQKSIHSISKEISDIEFKAQEAMNNNIDSYRIDTTITMTRLWPDPV